MDFEFQESDIVFTDQYRAARYQSGDEDEHGYYSFRDTMAMSMRDDLWARGKSNDQKTEKKKTMSSSPVNIPETFVRSPESDYASEEWDDGGGKMVPPHVIVGRRMAARMASLVCFSHGRTLKGRHLSEVRNSILRMTGFLES